MNKLIKLKNDFVKRAKSKTFWVSLSSLIVILLQMSGYEDIASKVPTWLNALLTFGVMIGFWKSYDMRGDE